MKLLLVEDDAQLSELIAQSLRQVGYALDVCLDGGQADQLLQVEQYDLVILDINLPDIDGFTILSNLRSRDQNTKVLILSALSQTGDKVHGLDLGANDYLAKPFHLDELEARIRNLLRWRFTQDDLTVHAGELTFNRKTREAYAKDILLNLTRKETGILEQLLLKQGRPVSQEELIDHVWESDVNSFSNVVRVHISSLRKKLKEALGYDPIQNKVGLGYQILGDKS